MAKVISEQYSSGLLLGAEFKPELVAVELPEGGAAQVWKGVAEVEDPAPFRGHPGFTVVEPEPQGEPNADELPGNFTGRGALVTAGVTTVAALIALTPEQLAAIPGLEPEKREKIAAQLEKLRAAAQPQQ